MKNKKPKLTRDEIIFNAAKLIAQDGLHQLTMRRLAATLNCSIGTLPHYFSGKDEIVESALHWSTERILTRVAEISSDDACIESFIPIIKSTLPCDTQADLEWRVRTALWAYSNSNAQIRQSLNDMAIMSFSLLREVIDTLKNKQMLRADVNTRDCAHQLYHMVNGLAFNLLQFPINEREQYLTPLMNYIDNLRA